MTGPTQLSPCRVSCLMLAFLWFLFSSIVGAQQTPNASPGFRPEAVYDLSELDDISLFNGTLSLSIPLGIQYPSGGAFSHRLRLDYSSTVWESFVYSSPCPTPSTCPVEFRPKSTHDAGLGWRLSLPELIPPGGWNQTTSRIYVGSDGGEHTFYDTLHASDPDDPGDAGSSQTVRYSRDGGYLRMTRVPGSSIVKVDWQPSATAAVCGMDHRALRLPGNHRVENDGETGILLRRIHGISAASSGSQTW